MSRLLRTIAVAVALLPIGVAYGQSTESMLRQYLLARVGTQATNAQPQFSDGKLYGCIIEFTALAQDFAYSSGNLIKIGGSFGLLSANKNMAVSLKVIVEDINLKTGSFTPSAPDSAYFISGTKSSKPFFAGKTPSDTPGAVFVLFKIDGGFETIMDAVSSDKLTIAFNRRKGGVDLQVPIDLTVEDTNKNGERTKSNKSTSEFLSCAGELVKSLR